MLEAYILGAGPERSELARRSVVMAQRLGDVALEAKAALLVCV